MKIGITADNYKLARFKKKLTKAGYQYEVVPFSEGTSVITVETNKTNAKNEIAKICTNIETFYGLRHRKN